MVTLAQPRWRRRKPKQRQWEMRSDAERRELMRRARKWVRAALGDSVEIIPKELNQ